MNSPTVVFLTSWEKFTASHSESHLVELSRTIQGLLDGYDKNVDYTCLYGALSDLTAEKTVSSLLLSHALSFVAKLAEENERRQDLMRKLLPSLSKQILYRYRQQPSDPLIKQCLDCLKVTSQDVRINHVSNETTQLVQLLLKIILRKDAYLLDGALGALANMSRNNLLIQSCVKSHESIRALYSTLMKLLGDEDMGIIVHSLALFTALCLNEDLGNKLFVGNVTETYTLVINLLKSDAPDIKIFCLNLLIDFTRSDTMLAAFVKCQESLLPELLNGDLIESSAPVRDKMCELLQHLATKNSDLYDTIRGLFTLDIAEQLLDILESKDSNNSVLSLMYVMLPDVLENSEENRVRLIKTLIRNIENIPLHSVCTPRYLAVTESCKCLRLLQQDSLCESAVISLLEPLPQGIYSWLDSTPSGHDTATQTYFSTEVCTAVLEMVMLCQDLKLKSCAALLSHPQLPTFLGKSLLSGDATLVASALQLVAMSHSTSQGISHMISGIVSHQTYMIGSELESTTTKLGELQNKYSDLQEKLSRQTSQEDEERWVPSPCPQITEIINQMRDGLNINDLKSSQLIEIFQEKIVIMTTKEEHLQDLIEAKTMALQQSDRLFTQFKNRVAQAERECSKYRSLLLESEAESESRQDQMCLVLKEKNDLLAEVEVLKGEVADKNKLETKYLTTCEELASVNDKYNLAAQLNSDLTDKLEGLKEEVEMLRVHNETLKSQHDSDVTQVQVLQKEKQKVVSKLEEKDSLYLKTKQSLRQTEEKVRRKDKERIELESQIAKLRSDLSKTETKFTELTEKEKLLECKSVEREKLVESQRDEISALKADIEKYSKLMAMFHNLSTVKPSQRPT